MTLRPFQKRFISAVYNRRFDVCAMSIPRGQGKSWIASHLLHRALTPGDRLFRAGGACMLLAGDLGQVQFVWGFLRPLLEADGYRIEDSAVRIGAKHPEHGTRLRVVSGKPKAKFGIVGVPLVVADEPGAWETLAGQQMFDALMTARGKPGSRVKLVFIGTLAPATSGWWHDMIHDGTRGSTYVQALEADAKKWDQWPEIRRVNPLMARFPESRRVLLEERDKARSDPAAKAQFYSFRLNVPSGDERTVVLPLSDWQTVIGRQVPAPSGRPVVGVDLGSGRSWSAAVALWPASGRCEALAVAPGIPALGKQEQRDRLPAGTYQKLHEAGRLHVAEGLRVPPVADVLRLVSAWRPVVIVADKHRLGELLDAKPPCPIETVSPEARGEREQDLRAFRTLALDGGLSVEQSSRDLIGWSLGAARVQAGKLAKSGSNQAGRDDVAAALVLAAGAAARRPKPKPLRWSA